MNEQDLNPDWLGWTPEERARIVKVQTPCPREWFYEIPGRPDRSIGRRAVLAQS